ncbi:MAG: hypothetical protein GQ564_08810 [Bacteroidales bacterium]|nr:hypothetical protein [Bacteroidales bacterium]
MNETKTFFSSELNAVVLELNGFLKTEQFIEFALESNDLRKKHSVYKQLNNIQNMKVLTKDIQNWLEDVWFPEAKISGLKYFAFVVPNDTFGKSSMDTVNSEATAKYGINIEYFTDKEVAKQWLVSQ